MPAVRSIGSMVNRIIVSVRGAPSPARPVAVIQSHHQHGDAAGAIPGLGGGATARAAAVSARRGSRPAASGVEVAWASWMVMPGREVSSQEVTKSRTAIKVRIAVRAAAMTKQPAGPGRRKWLTVLFGAQIESIVVIFQLRSYNGATACRKPSAGYNQPGISASGAFIARHRASHRRHDLIHVFDYRFQSGQILRPGRYLLRRLP